MGTAVVVHGEGWTALSDRLDRAEALNRELMDALSRVLPYAMSYRDALLSDKGVSFQEVDSDIHVAEVVLTEIQEEVE